jgi:hypothetical protein
VDSLVFGLPLLVPGTMGESGSDATQRNAKPQTATQLYREVDRLMTTVVRSVEVHSQIRR